MNQETELSAEARANNVKWMKQTIGNACGTIGIIHSIINNIDSIKLEDNSVMKNFLSDIEGKNGEEIGKLLESNADFASLHKRSCASSSNQTQADETTKVRDHFVSLVNSDGILYEVRDYSQSSNILLFI